MHLTARERHSRYADFALLEATGRIALVVNKLQSLRSLGGLHFVAADSKTMPLVALGDKAMCGRQLLGEVGRA